MSRPFKSPAPMPQPMPVSAPPAPEEPELPVVGPLLGWHKTPKGYVVLAVKVQGDRVVETEVINPDGRPAPRHHAEAYLRKALAQRLLLRRGDA